MNILKSIQSWASSLVNRWEEDEHKGRVARLRSTATIFPEINKYTPMPPVKLPRVEACMGQEIEDKPVVKEVSIQSLKQPLTEPVELIIKAMKERPEMFEIKRVCKLY